MNYYYEISITDNIGIFSVFIKNFQAFLLILINLMQKDIFSQKQAYRFIKVQDFFDQYQSWRQIIQATDAYFDDKTDTLYLDLLGDDHRSCSMLIQCIQSQTTRICFNPQKNKEQLMRQNLRTSESRFNEMNRITQMKSAFEMQIKFILNEKELTEAITIINYKQKKAIFKVHVDYQPFKIKIIKLRSDQDNYDQYLIWESSNLLYIENGDDYSIIQAIKKPSTAKYVGFGGQGGSSLTKNTLQMNFFNFDNSYNRQIYNKGPLDQREPLSHSEPLFFEFNANPNEENAYAFFVDNPGQVLMDIGYANNGTYMVGTRFGDLDFYIVNGNNTTSIIQNLTEIIGRPQMLPRYALGYHQGSYGYENRYICEQVVQKHRDYRIPLDGLHIDIDIHKYHQNFTIDTNRFPNPQEFFRNLRKKGVKCSINTTPILLSTDQNYPVYEQGKAMGYLIFDQRFQPDSDTATCYQQFSEGIQWENNQTGYIEKFNSGKPFVGGVCFGNEHIKCSYPNLAVDEVQKWWGMQYECLFNYGVQMIWQSMEVPTVVDYRGDMKGFPFKLMLDHNFKKPIRAIQDTQKQQKTPAIKIWNQYAYNLQKGTCQGVGELQSRKNKKNFIISQGGCIGSHRYTALCDSNNTSEWDFLKLNLTRALSIGICGKTIYGQDIGGFGISRQDNGQWVDPQLLIRWTALGAFLPWFRNNYVRKGKKLFQEPYMYEQWFNTHSNGHFPEPQEMYQNVLPICRHYIGLRYQFLQLFYDLSIQSTKTGLPICRPLFLEAPSDHHFFNDKEKFLSDQFFLGKNLLIAPILHPQKIGSVNNNGHRDIYLPNCCNWYSFTNNSQLLHPIIQGGKIIRDFNASIGSGIHINFVMPIYIRQGAIVPTQETEQYVGQKNDRDLPNPITFNIYPGNTGSYEMYIDDGITKYQVLTNYQLDSSEEHPQASYRHIQITHNTNSINSPKTKTIEIIKIHDGYTPKYEDFYYINVLHDPFESIVAQVKINDEVTDFIEFGDEQVQEELSKICTMDCWYSKPSIKSSMIKVFDQPTLKIQLTYK